MYSTCRFVKFDRPSKDWIWLYEHQSSSRLSPRSSSLSNFLITFRPTLKIFKLGRDRATPNLSIALVDSCKCSQAVKLFKLPSIFAMGGTWQYNLTILASAATSPVLASKFLMAAPQVVIFGLLWLPLYYGVLWCCGLGAGA